MKKRSSFTRRRPKVTGSRLEAKKKQTFRRALTRVSRSVDYLMKEESDAE